MKLDSGRLPSAAHDFDVSPSYAAHACAEQLHSRLFRREPARELRRASAAVRYFALGVNPAQESFPIAFVNARNAWYLDYVDSRYEQDGIPVSVMDGLSLFILNYG